MALKIALTNPATGAVANHHKVVGLSWATDSPHAVVNVTHYFDDTRKGETFSTTHSFEAPADGNLSVAWAESKLKELAHLGGAEHVEDVPPEEPEAEKTGE